MLRWVVYHSFAVKGFVQKNNVAVANIFFNCKLPQIKLCPCRNRLHTVPQGRIYWESPLHPPTPQGDPSHCDNPKPQSTISARPLGRQCRRWPRPTLPQPSWRAAWPPAWSLRTTRKLGKPRAQSLNIKGKNLRLLVETRLFQSRVVGLSRNGPGCETQGSWLPEPRLDAADASIASLPPTAPRGLWANAQRPPLQSAPRSLLVWFSLRLSPCHALGSSSTNHITKLGHPSLAH